MPPKKTQKIHSTTILNGSILEDPKDPPNPWIYFRFSQFQGSAQQVLKTYEAPGASSTLLLMKAEPKTGRISARSNPSETEQGEFTGDLRLFTMNSGNIK